MRANCRRWPLCARTTRAPANWKGAGCLGDDRLVGVGDPADVGDQARRRELGREEAQVAVERRQGGRAVAERLLGPQRRRVPRLHPNPARFRNVFIIAGCTTAARGCCRCRTGGAADGERLTQVGQDPAHGADRTAHVRRLSSALCSERPSGIGFDPTDGLVRPRLSNRGRRDLRKSSHGAVSPIPAARSSRPRRAGFDQRLPVTGTLAGSGRASSGRRTRLDDLGVAPSTQTQELHKQLLR